MLTKQNKCLLLENELKVIKASETRFNNSKFQAIIEADSVSYKNIMDVENLFVNWASCKVYEYTDLVRCFKFLGCNHFAKGCKNEKMYKFCASNHDSTACPNSSTSQNYKCVNCSYHVDILIMHFDVNYHVTSTCKNVNIIYLNAQSLFVNYLSIRLLMEKSNRLRCCVVKRV